MTADMIFELLQANETLIMVSSAVSVLTCAFFVYRTLLYRDPLADRLAGIAVRQRSLKADLVAPRSRRGKLEAIGLMRGLVQKLKLLKTTEAKKAALQLSQAGYRGKDALIIYFFLKLALPFVFGGLAVLFLYIVPVMPMASGSKALVAMSAVVLGAFLPNVLVKNATTKRQKAIRKGTPDALDLLVICAEAGQSLDAALKRVAKEIGSFTPEIAEELALTSVELGLLPDRKRALDNLVARANIPELKNVVNALAQTEKYGTPLAHSLRVLSAEYRQERFMKAEEKAARLPAIMTVPMIIFILPPLFIVLLGPAILNIIDLLIKM
ncbi:MAG: type II secretion system F family protein [Alphaproteobacteria bacterium]|nr:type II secretion system F family protein [Alphaproteobacteria bacterium]